MKTFPKIILGCITTCLFLFAGCDSDEDTPTTLERWVYYPVSATNGAPSGETGLYRIGLSNGAPERITNVSIENITGVAQNGVIVMEYGENVAHKLYGRCEDGALIPVPFPVSDDISWEYQYALPPFAALSYDGHHAVYPVTYKPVAQADPELRQAKLVLFNCANGEMKILDVHMFVKNVMQTVGATNGRISGECLLISKDGGTIWFACEGLRYESGKIISTGYQIFEWAEGQFNTIGDITADTITLAGYDHISNTLLYMKSQNLYARSLSSGIELLLDQTAFTLSNPHQLAISASLMAVWGQSGLELRNPANGAILSTVISWDELKRKAALSVVEPTPKLTVSPDGEWIVFALRSKMTGALPQDYDILIIKSDGSGLRRIWEKVAIGTPVISTEVSKR